MRHIPESGIQTDDDIVDIPQQANCPRSYSERFDLWGMRNEIEKLCRRSEQLEDQIRTLETRVRVLETDLKVITRMVNEQ
jgi:hypothetical protein